MPNYLKENGMNNLLAADKKNIWHPFTPLTDEQEPVFIESAKGVYLFTADGKKIIDAVSSWWVNIHGHANTTIADAIAAQARKLEHVIFAGFTHEPAIRLSQNLLSILPKNQSRIFFSDNGSTAVEVGIKMALQYWYNQGKARNKIVAIEGAYHGDTFGSMSVGGRSMFTDPFSDNLFETYHIKFPDAKSADLAFQQFKTYLDNHNIAAFIFEPLVQGAAGMRMYSPDVLDQMMAYAKQRGVVCIADEVFTGFGRTGKLFASEYLSHQPDIITVSKGITGGTLPLGVTSCSSEIQDAFRTSDFTKTFFHGHSYTANPLACAAANASFELLMSDPCQQQITMISEMHARQVEKWRHHPRVSEARSRGTILAIELISEEETSYSNDLRKKIYPYFLERGVLLRPLGNVIYILPPYVITENELTYIYQQIDNFLNEV
jgi:adenosylmethionine-8-amino-7-oxononanoate aminotransferase